MGVDNLRLIKANCIVNGITYKEFLNIMGMNKNTFENRLLKCMLSVEQCKKIEKIFIKKVKIIGD